MLKEEYFLGVKNCFKDFLHIVSAVNENVMRKSSWNPCPHAEVLNPDNFKKTFYCLVLRSSRPVDCVSRDCEACLKTLEII